jgi:MFS family permease
MLVERAGEKRFPWSAGQASVTGETNVRNLWEVSKSMLVAFSLPTTIVYIFFTLTKLIGVGINEVVTNTLYTQQLDPKWTDIEFSTASGLYSLAPIIVGAVLGGFLADRFGRHLILLAGFGSYGIGAMVFAACRELWNERWFTVSYILYCETMFAVGAVGFLSMAMRISWTKSAAIVFTLYLTLSNVSHVAGNWLAGPVRTWLKFGDDSTAADLLSYELTFWFIGVVTLLPTLLLFWVRPSEVDRRRDRPDRV